MFAAWADRSAACAAKEPRRLQLGWFQALAHGPGSVGSRAEKKPRRLNGSAPGAPPARTGAGRHRWFDRGFCREDRLQHRLGDRLTAVGHVGKLDASATPARLVQ
jgi:hypothetical protein